MGRSDDYPVKLETAFGGIELQAVNAERVMLQVGVPVNVEERLAPLTINGVTYHGSAMLHAGSERGDGGEGWRCGHVYEDRGRTVDSRGLWFARDGSFSFDSLTPAAEKKLRPELERVVNKWAETAEARVYLEEKQRAWTAQELELARDGLEKAYTHVSGEPSSTWAQLEKELGRYVIAAERAGVLELQALELKAEQIADAIEAETVPENTLALAALAALIVQKRTAGGHA